MATFFSTLFATVLVFLIGFTGYITIVSTDSGKGKWGGLGETCGVFLFGLAAFLASVMLLPENALWAIRNHGPWNPHVAHSPGVSTSLFTPPAVNTTPAPGTPGLQNLEILQVTNPTSAHVWHVTLKFDSRQISSGILIPRDRMGGQVWTESGTGASKASEF